MSNLTIWAKNELIIAGVERKDEMIEIMEAFSNQGHSGFSANYALSFINKAIEQGYEVVEEKLNNMLGEDEDGMQQHITNDIMEILNLFKKHNLKIEELHQVSRLMNCKPISPLTGEDDEWDKGTSSQQNKRCSAVFRNNLDNTTAHYIDGKVFSDDGGKTWWTNYKSSIPVEFPFNVPDEPERIILKNGDLD